MKKKNPGEAVLSSYELGILRGNRKTASDEITEQQCFKQVLQNQLGVNIVKKLPDGTEVTATAMELVTASAINDAIEKGSIDKVASFMKVLGEFKEVTTEVNISQVDSDLEKRAIE